MSESMELSTDCIDIDAQKYLKDDFPRLMEFFRETWEEPSPSERYAYRVYLAQKCFNLNELFFRVAYEHAEQAERHRLREIREKTFLSQSGLVMQAGNLAVFYTEHQSFPKILICDELLKTGHDLMDILSSVSDAVVEELLGLDQDDSSDAWAIRTKLLDALSFCSYMQSKEDSRLLSSYYLKKTLGSSQWSNAVPASKWFAFVQDSSAAILSSSHVKNTIFTPTFWISPKCYYSIIELLNSERSNSWRHESWLYWGQSADIWQRTSYDVNNEPCIQQAVRCSFQKQSGEYAITPYLFWKVLRDEENELLFLRLAEAMRHFSFQSASSVPERHPLDPFIRLLTIPKRYALAIKSQFLFSLGSLLLFYGFIEELRLDNSIRRELLEARSDLEKVSECYGSIDKISSAFTALISEEALPLRASLRDIIRDCLLCHAGSLGADNRDDSQHHRDFYLLKATEQLLSVDETQQKLIQYRKKHQIYYCAISQYHQADGFLADYLESFPADYSSLDRKFGALLILLMWGVTGFAIHRKTSESSQQYSDIYLNVGESTELVRAIQTLRFLPALEKIDQICVSEYYLPRKMIASFGRYLNKKDHSADYEAAFLQFYDWCINTGRTLADWGNLDLTWLTKPDQARQVRTIQEWNAQPWPEAVLKAHNTEEYQRWEKQQQAYYLDQVRLFFSGQ